MGASCPLTLIGGQGSNLLVRRPSVRKQSRSRHDPGVEEGLIAGASLLQSLAASPTNALACAPPSSIQLSCYSRTSPLAGPPPRQPVCVSRIFRAAPSSSVQVGPAAVACPATWTRQGGKRRSRIKNGRGEGACLLASQAWSTPKQRDASNDLTPLLHVGLA